MPPAITFRDAGPQDYDTARKLALAAYDEYRALIPPDRWEWYAADIANIESRAADSTLILAEVDGRPVGCVTFYPDGSRGQHWPPTYAAIRLLGVAPEARGQGAGRALTEECARRARALGRTHLGLHTVSFMATARAMYRRLGFQPVPGQDMHFSTMTIEALELDLTRHADGQ